VNWKFFLFSFLLGIVGGIFGTQVLWPYFLQKIFKINYFYQEPLIIFQSRKIEEKKIKNILEEQKRQILKDIQSSLVTVNLQRQNQKNFYSLGLIVSSDGFILTPANFIKPENKIFVYLNEKIYEPKIIKVDYEKKIALLKIEEKNLKTPSFYSEKPFLGDRLFIFFLQEKNQFLFLESLVSLIEETKIEINPIPQNSPFFAFNTDGYFLGIGFLDNKGNLYFLSSKEIKEFLNF
jgi:hypothetical protein